VEKYRDDVIVFSKSEYRGKFDIMDNFQGNKVIVYARNACYDIARKLGLDYFFEFEDDYNQFTHRFSDGDKLGQNPVKNMDKILDAMIDCLDTTGASTIALSQGGDFIGGLKTFKREAFKRKAMNSFVFKVNKDPADDVIFIGRMNDDVNTYLTLGKVGKIFSQVPNVMLNQAQTQASAGGNTEVYKEYGTYAKSFYSVMAAPSCCKVKLMGTTNQRLHHNIKWVNAVPKIIDEKFKL
jgi:hypothetical protein